MFCSFCMSTVYVLVGLAAIYLAARFVFKKKPVSIRGKHVLVTGGSLGIGRCVALEAARRGAHVTLVARGVENLELALAQVKEQVTDPELQKIQYRSIDLSSDFSALEAAVWQLEDEVGPVFMLVNCAGTSLCGKLEDLTDKDIKYLLDLNLLGSILACKAVVPRMKARREGRIVLTSSQAGLLGIFGFSVYSATKFALRGLAEALQMEVKPYEMRVTLALPPDTDTPGFAEEQKSKPLETRLISETAGIYRPEQVAKQLLDDALHGNFFSSIGFESALVTATCAGMAPCDGYGQLLIQVLGMGVLRLVGVLVLNSFNGIVRKCYEERNSHKKAE